MTTVKLPLALVATFLWIGFVCAISFMEAWLKFRAPGINLPLGLGIGQLVFDALNKVEWTLAIAIFINLTTSKTRLFSIHNATYFTSLIILTIQSLWLLPDLDVRAELIIQNQSVTNSNLHFYYVGFEFVKITCLSIFGISLFKSVTK